MNSSQKYYLKCHSCGQTFSGLKAWFSNFQTCFYCGGKRVIVHYNNDISTIKSLIRARSVSSFWHYFDFLPLNYPDNIISFGEGIVPTERWKFLEKYAKANYNLNLEVWAYRNDLSPGTGTFKDVAGSLTASALLENGITQFCAASTGNIATALARYLAKANISFSVFLPEDALLEHEAEISLYGQRAFKVKGNYALAKKFAGSYSFKNHILISGGNVDPMRVEAKKTQVFEWLRQIGSLPDVYIQALSGGTGPIAIEKAVNDLQSTGLVKKIPKMLLVQPSACDPMSQAWKSAKEKNFPEGFENEYPIIENPETLVPTLATGNPATYPVIAKIVKHSDGEIFSFDEELIYEIAKWVGYENTVKIGPASAIAVGGFLEALKNGYLTDGQSVMINIGEGAQRATGYIDKAKYSHKNVNSEQECEVFHRSTPPLLWKK